MRIRTRLVGLLILVVAVLATTVLSACGSGSGSSSDAKSLLAAGFSKPIPKATVALDIGAKLQGVAALAQPVSLKLSGPYESRGKNKAPKLDLDVSVSGGGQTFTGKLLSTGDNAFVGFSGQNYEVGTQAVRQFEQQLAASTSQSQSKTLKQLGIDPQSWLKDPKTAGDEDVAGTKTTKITGKVDVGKFVADLNSATGKASGAMGRSAPQKLSAAQIKKFTDAVKDPKFEVFVAKGDKTIRKITASLDFTVPKAQQTQTQGVTGGSITFSIQFSNVGQPAQVTAPTGTKPITELVQQIKNLTGSGSSSSGSNGGGSAGSGATPDQYQKYADCLNKAGKDQKKTAACLDLLK